jgi:hypothetical protein
LYFCADFELGTKKMKNLNFRTLIYNNHAVRLDAAAACLLAAAADRLLAALQ